MSKILVIDDDLASCRTLQLHFGSLGHNVTAAHSAEAGLAEASRMCPELVILDIRMPGRSGLDALPELKQALPDIRIIMITAFHDMENTIQAMKRGADDYILKPIDIDELDASVERVMRYSRPGEEAPVITLNASGAPGRYAMVGRSRAMQEVFKTIGLVAPSMATVLITGESGTGKELVARAIHRTGLNPSGPFVAVNCAALVETLLESEMFGHEKGAFTGAVDRHPGKFAMADGGTIFLDEVSELSVAIQAKLLRVLQEKEYLPVGGQKPRATNARVIAATNVDLREGERQGAFREDLYYRLQVVNIPLPPLREREEDFPDLIWALLARINREVRRNVTRVHTDVVEQLQAYHWPGNIRELENVLMRAVVLSPGDVITCEVLPPHIRGGTDAATAQPPVNERSLWDVEKAHVQRVLENTGWHRGHACDILGMSRPRLRRMIKKFGLVPPADAPPDDCEPPHGTAD